MEVECDVVVFRDFLETFQRLYRDLIETLVNTRLLSALYLAAGRQVSIVYPCTPHSTQKTKKSCSGLNGLFQNHCPSLCKRSLQHGKT